MYRDGNFQSLRWNMLEASHKAHWEKLSSVYGLEEPEKLLKSEAQKKDMPVLDQLAELCICSCQNYLFSLTPVKDVSNVFNDVLTAPDDLPRRIRRDMPHHFELALRDHLIVTFAYRFCCDNLEPRSFDDYVNTLFDYIAKTENPAISRPKRSRCRSSQVIIDSPTPFSALYDCLWTKPNAHQRAQYNSISAHHKKVPSSVHFL